MRTKVIFLLYLLLWVSAPGWAKSEEVGRISLPIRTYRNFDTGTWEKTPGGELLIVLTYWNTFSSPDNNSYSLDLYGFPDSSRDKTKTIFNSHISGSSVNEVKRNSRNRTTWYESTNTEGCKHFIQLSNGVWATRFVCFDDNDICVVYGRLSDDKNKIGKVTKSIFLSGGEETWRKLVNFLRNAHNHNIGRTVTD